MIDNDINTFMLVQQKIFFITNLIAKNLIRDYSRFGKTGKQNFALYLATDAHTRYLFFLQNKNPGFVFIGAAD